MKRKFTSKFKVCLLTLAMALAGQEAWSQTSERNVLSDISESSIPQTGGRYTIPKHYRTLRLNKTAMQQLLAQAPMESASNNRNSTVIFSMPMPDGTTSNFRIVETEVMAPELAARFPDIKTYGGQGIDDPNAIIKLDLTPLGFHAMVLSDKGSVFINPYSAGTTADYICYYKRDLAPTAPFICGVENSGTPADYRKIIPQELYAQKTSGTQLRTYRLALACTGEYAAFFGGTVPGAMAGMVTSMNRVNGVYETEVAIHMTMVANNSSLIYTNSGTDPYTNGSGGTMLGQNITTCNSVIGSANYDIGHVFSTGGGGVAYLGCVCTANKAGGVTGSSSPTGDGYDIDYVSHEMGHQFGGNHTFNSVTGACGGGNRNANTAYEPGSGITIMAYAGICGSDDIAPHSIAYFHTISFDEIVNYSTTGGGNTCAATTATGNIAPVVTSMGTPYTIPVSTPFVLTGTATDGNSDPLTYSWEEFDLGAGGAWNVQSTTAPMFTPLTPTVSGSRTFPKLSDIINNTTTVGELLPGNARTLKFRLTVRDNRTGGGGVMHPDTTLNITVVNNGGAFTVTAPNTAVSWAGGSSQTVTWNVNGTTNAPISCANVKISLSTDGGNTFPTVIAASTANDGTELITVPGIATTQARIKVEAVGNIFFDMSNVNFTITNTGLSAISTSAIAPLSYCAGAAVSVPFTVTGNANAGNVFTAQISNSSGSFAAPTAIGTLTSTTAGTINATIPGAVTTGSGYRIRVVSSNPVVTGSDNGSNIAIAAQVAAAGPINGSSSVCAGSASSYSVPAIANATSYNWTLPANCTIQSGSGTSSIVVEFLSNAASGNITVAGVNASCTGTASSLSVTVNPLPLVSFTGLAASYPVSAGAVTLNGAPAGGTFSGPGISGNTFTPAAAGVGGPYTITYSYTDNNGCSASSSQQTTVTGCPPPAKPAAINSIGGYQKMCPGDTKSYKITAVSGATSYTWTAPVGATIASGQGTVQVSVNYNAGFVATDTLRVTANNACGSSDQQKLKITRNTPPIPSVITGDKFGVCGATGVPYSVVNVAGMTYNWTNSNVNATVATGQGSNAITADFNAAYVQGNFSVTANNACGAGPSRSLLVKAIPATAASITGATVVCANQFGVPYSTAPIASAINYTWVGPTGSHISDGSVTSTGATLITTATSVTVNYGATAGNLKVRGNNPCGAGVYKIVAITFNCRQAGNMDNGLSLGLYPNPAENAVTVTFNAGDDSKYEMQLSDLLGNAVLSYNGTAQAGENSVTLSLDDVVAGVYMLQFKTAGETKVLKLVVN